MSGDELFCRTLVVAGRSLTIMTFTKYGTIPIAHQVIPSCLNSKPSSWKYLPAKALTEQTAARKISQILKHQSLQPHSTPHPCTPIHSTH